MEGCDIEKSRDEIVKAGFSVTPGTEKPAAQAATSARPYAGHCVAKSDTAATVVTIRVHAKAQVWVDGKKVKADVEVAGESVLPLHPYVAPPLPPSPPAQPGGPETVRGYAPAPLADPAT